MEDEDNIVCPPLRSNRCGQSVIWAHLPNNVVKINFDGSKISNGSSSFGLVIREHSGEFLLAGTNSLGRNTSILQAEACGILEAIRGAHFLNLPNVVMRETI